MITSQCYTEILEEAPRLSDGIYVRENVTYIVRSGHVGKLAADGEIFATVVEGMFLNVVAKYSNEQQMMELLRVTHSTEDEQQFEKHLRTVFEKAGWIC